jgi:transposase
MSTSRTGAEPIPSRFRLLWDRFSVEELQAMIDLYRSGMLVHMVAERYGVSLRSVKRLRSAVTTGPDLPLL